MKVSKLFQVDKVFFPFFSPKLSWDIFFVIIIFLRLAGLIEELRETKNY